MRCGAGVGQLREAEVEDLDAAVARHEYVLGLDVAVHDAAVVRGRKTGRQLDRKLNRPAHRQPTRGVVQDTSKGRAVEQLRDDVRGRAVGTDLVNRQDVRMVQRSRGASFLFEATEPIRIGAGRQDLDRDVAAEPGVARAVDLAHPAGADERHDFVRANPGTWDERHQEGT